MSETVQNISIVGGCSFLYFTIVGMFIARHLGRKHRNRIRR